MFIPCTATVLFFSFLMFCWKGVSFSCGEVVEHGELVLELPW